MLTNERENVSRKMASFFKDVLIALHCSVAKIGTIYIQGVPSFWKQSFNTNLFIKALKSKNF